MLGGRSVASVGNNTGCQQGLKAVPLAKIKKEVRKFVAEQQGIKPKNAAIVSLIGTRFDESASRKRMMEERGESATDAVEVMADTGDLVLSPIADWDAFDVFGYIGMVRSKRIECYDDLEELVQVYRDAGGGTCMVNSYLANKEADKAPCSARTGCWTCTRVSRDKSAENMIDAEDGKFEWMRPLNDFRNYLAARHFDPTARCWLGRTVNAQTGNLSIMPNSYSPTFTKELLGILLTMQVEEEIAASRLGIPPRFTVLTLRQVMAIEILWSRYSYQSPWTAVRMYRAVYERGERYRIPDLSSIPKFTEKDIAFRAEVPFCDDEYDNPFSGLRNIEWAVADCEETTLTRAGKLVTRVNTGTEFDVCSEGSELFYAFDLERALSRITINDSPASVVHYLIGLGTVQLYKGTESEWDRMLKVSNQVHRHGLQPILNDPHAIIAKLAAFREGSIQTGQSVMDLA
jgi:3'-phosphoadenosine 5'-phosphosulfate sulfotransferase (PAPS reductase)/FAD synthetase